MNKIIITPTLFMMLLLTSCSSVNSNFDCPMKPGVRCESIDKVNARVDSGEIGHTGGLINKAIVKDIERGSEKMGVSSYAGYYQAKPLRYGETVQRIWIAPFEDTSGNYHQESYVYTIVKPGHWIGYPVKTTVVE